MDSVKNLRQVSIRYENDEEYTRYLVIENDIKNMVEALIKLHIEPGINPHNKGKGKKIVEITLDKPVIDSYWWTSSDLIGKDPNKKAKIIQFYGGGEVIFLSREMVIDRYSQFAGENAANSYACTLEDDPEWLDAEIKRIEKMALAYVHPDYVHLFKKLKFTTEL